MRHDDPPASPGDDGGRACDEDELIERAVDVARSAQSPDYDDDAWPLLQAVAERGTDVVATAE